MACLRAQSSYQPIIGDQKKYLDLTKQEWQKLMQARLEFRQLLETHSLVRLAGGVSDALDFLENEITKIADSVARRERFLRLLREARAILNQQAEQQGANGDLLDGMQKKKPHSSVKKKFRRFNLANFMNG